MAAGYKDQKEGVKVGPKGGKLSLTKYPPDWDIFWEKQLHSCQVQVERKQAGPLLLLQVAGRPHPLAGRLGVKKVNHIFWPATSW